MATPITSDGIYDYQIHGGKPNQLALIPTGTAAASPVATQGNVASEFIAAFDASAGANSLTWQPQNDIKLSDFYVIATGTPTNATSITLNIVDDADVETILATITFTATLRGVFRVTAWAAGAISNNFLILGLTGSDRLRLKATVATGSAVNAYVKFNNYRNV